VTISAIASDALEPGAALSLLYQPEKLTSSASHTP